MKRWDALAIYAHLHGMLKRAVGAKIEPSAVSSIRRERLVLAALGRSKEPHPGRVGKARRGCWCCHALTSGARRLRGGGGRIGQLNSLTAFTLVAAARIAALCAVRLAFLRSRAASAFSSITTAETAPSADDL